MPSLPAPVSAYPAYFVGHAGVGLLFRPGLEVVQENLRSIGEDILQLSPRPRALIVTSGHFTADPIHGPGVIEVNVKAKSHIQHDFVNDFHDSHPFVYDYDWPHKDSPDLANEVWKHLKGAGIKTKRVERGIDHGVWVPFKIMFPEETPLDIPVILVSTYYGSDLSQQIKLGEALSVLRSQGFVVVGSGMAVHSFDSIEEIYTSKEELKEAARERVQKESVNFDRALRGALSNVSAVERRAALLALEDLSEFKRSHPTVEHLTPLLVSSGAAGDAQVTQLGAELVEPGFSYANYKFQSV